MGILSGRASITRYTFQQAVFPEELAFGLSSKIFQEPPSVFGDAVVPEIVSGWVPVDHAYDPEQFENDALFIGRHAVFGMRIDEKKIPSRMLKARVTKIVATRLKESGREFISKSEKGDIKEAAMLQLLGEVPYTPQVIEISLNLDTNEAWVFSTGKRMCEIFEELMAITISSRCVRLFPYTLALPAPEGYGLLTPSEMVRLAEIDETELFGGEYA